MRFLSTMYGVFLLGIACLSDSTAQSAPAISLRSPPLNAVISQALTPSILLQASVTGSEAPIAHVVLYVCPLKDGTCSVGDRTQFDIAVPPYEVRWTPPRIVPQPDGAIPYQAWAMVVNALGQAWNSSFTTFSLIQSPYPPSVTLVAPRLEGGYVTPTSPVLYATAAPGTTDPPSSIVRVDFLDGGTVIGSVTAPNSLPSGYAFIWENASPGIHLVAARATDTLGFSATTDAVTVFIIGPDPPPIVTLTTPSTGQIFAPPNAVPLAATATSAGGTIQRVEFVAADRVVATALGPPFVANWNNPPAGNFAVVAKAYDDIGVATTSPAAYIQILPRPRIPAVVVTAPAPGVSVASGSPLPMAATALAPDGSIGRVDFYAGTTFLGSVASPPYQFTWGNPTSGPQWLIAKGYDLQGFAGESAMVEIDVINNRLPVVAIAAPSGGAQFMAPATIALSATTSDPDGIVTKIEYFANGIKVATATEPFSATWPNVRAGAYTLTAVATDNLYATATSPPVSVTVAAPAPTVTLAAPQSGATFALGQSIVITAQARAPQGSVSRVEIYSDGNVIGSLPVSGGPSAIDVSLTWTHAAAGAHSLSAKVVTADSASAQSANVNVVVSDFTIALIEPFSGQVYQSPGDVRITANPTEPGATISQVDFYGDGTLLGSRSSPPYAILWAGVSTGTHVVSVRARDGVGLTASSASVSVAVVAAPTLQVDAGIDGSTIADDNASVSGSVQAPSNAAVTVNGRVVALDRSGRFFVDGVILAPGANTIDLTLLTENGVATSRTIALSRSGTMPFQVDVDRQEGIVPFDVTLTVTDRGNVSFQRIEIDGNGDGTPEKVLTSLPDNAQDIPFHILSPGTYSINVKVIDANNSVIYTATRRVLAWDPESAGRRAIGVYTGMLDRLQRGDIDAALTAVSSLVYEKYRDIFSNLKPDLPTIVNQLGTIQHVTISGEILQILISRPGSQGPSAFSIEMIRGSDGIWRIEGM